MTFESLQPKAILFREIQCKKMDISCFNSILSVYLVGVR